ncbi:MAG: hypothetical protein NTU84_04695, partial [Verrucomicrobia bacterium]|nr:hypothetical protein [Verrucomicrobiota bacterium]
ETEEARKTAKACSRFGQERSDVARRAERAGGARESKEATSSKAGTFVPKGPAVDESLNLLFLWLFKTWSGTLHGRPRVRCSSYDEEVSRKMRDTAGGTPALPFEESASSFSFPNDR